MSLLNRWREVAHEYHQIKSASDDLVDLVSCLVFTLGTLALGLGVVAIFGGCHG